jgi:hypothetical protein
MSVLDHIHTSFIDKLNRGRQSASSAGTTYLKVVAGDRQDHLRNHKDSQPDWLPIHLHVLDLEMTPGTHIAPFYLGPHVVIAATVSCVTAAIFATGSSPELLISLADQLSSARRKSTSNFCARVAKDSTAISATLRRVA